MTKKLVSKAKISNIQCTDLEKYVKMAVLGGIWAFWVKTGFFLEKCHFLMVIKLQVCGKN